MPIRLLLAAALAGPVCAAATPAPAPSDDCRIGAYLTADARIIDIGAASAGLRWRMPDGRTGIVGPEGLSTRGSTGRADGHRIAFDPCPGDMLHFDGVPAQRIAFDVVETAFDSGGERLAGRLVLPAEGGAVPLVVLVHGSEKHSALRFDAWQRLLPAHGIGAFVYDKRGTGRSTGRYTQDFHVLADDAAAAAREARRLAGARVASLVYAGASQGGWVLPLAQQRHRADRLIVSYGLTVSPLEENRSEVLQQLAARGYGDVDLRAADDVVQSTAALIASGFREGFGRYSQLRRRYGAMPWYREIGGEFSGEILRYPPWLLRLAAPIARRRDVGTPWRHDPLPPLRAVDVPLLWVLAGDDTEAPPAQTRRDLARLQAEGRAVAVLEFPDTDHGIVEFETDPQGRRVTTRVAEGYLQAVIDFAREGRLGAVDYGRAVRSDPAGTKHGP